MPPLGLPTDDSIGERSIGEIVTGVRNLSPCNHEEADTRIMYYCPLEDKPTMVIASDTVS